jgi:uncharacterized membrane protein (UPF0136 family)
MEKHFASTIMALAITALYGLTALLCGIIGYVKAGSLPSLIAGGISGILLLACAAAMNRYHTPSLFGALIVALALMGKFAPKAIGLADKPAGTVDYVMTAGGIAVLATALLALVISFRPSSGP